MSKKISVLGVSVDNYSVKDAMLLADEYLNNDYMNTIGNVTAESLIMASESPELKEIIENFDMTLIGSAEILEAAGAADQQRIEEIEEEVFIRQFFKNAATTGRTVYILSESLQVADEMGSYIENTYEGLDIAGICVIENSGADDDRIINEINSVAPDIIMAFMESPFQEEFILNNKSKLCAKAWLGMGTGLGMIKKKNWLVAKVGKELFRRKVAKYNSRSEA